MSIKTGVVKAFRAAGQRNWYEAFKLLRIHAGSMDLTTPSSLTLDSGTSYDSVSDMATMFDGNEYTLSGVPETPGMSLTLFFTGVQEIGGLLVRMYYSGSAARGVEVQLYNYTTTLWNTYMTIETGNGYNVRYVRLPSDDDYISSDTAQVRIQYPQSGNASHEAYIDYIGLEM